MAGVQAAGYQVISINYINDSKRSANSPPDFNRRFTERPALKETAFVRLGGTDLELLLSIQHQRIVGNDNVVSLRGMELQLPPTRLRPTHPRSLPGDGARAPRWNGRGQLPGASRRPLRVRRLAPLSKKNPTKSGLTKPDIFKSL